MLLHGHVGMWGLLFGLCAAGPMAQQPAFMATAADNYLSLMPLETVEVCVEFKSQTADAGCTWLLMKGWNVPFQALKVESMPDHCHHVAYG